LVNLNKAKRLYYLDSRLLKRLLTKTNGKLKCHICGGKFKVGDYIFSKKTKYRTKYYCIRCAMKSGQIGIKHGYPILREKFGKIMDYIALCRPFTLLAPILAGFFGVLIQLAYYNQLNLFFKYWNVIIYVAVTMMLAQACGQVLNQASDVEIDRINRPYRPIPAGRITKDEAFGFGLILLMVALLRSFTINITFGTIMLLILFFAVFYNLPPIRAKKYFGINLAWMAISRGLLPFLASWSVFGNMWNVTPWILGIYATLWVINWQPTKDFPDIKGDKLYGIQTLPVKLGKKGAIEFMKTFVTVPFIFMICAITFGLLNILYIALVTMLLCLSYYNISNLEVEAKITENTRAWMGFYGGLSLIYFLSFIIEWCS